MEDFRKYLANRLNEGTEPDVATLYKMVQDARKTMVEMRTNLDRLITGMDQAMAKVGMSSRHPDHLGFEDWEKSNRAHQARMGTPN